MPSGGARGIGNLVVPFLEQRKGWTDLPSLNPFLWKRKNYQMTCSFIKKSFYFMALFRQTDRTDRVQLHLYSCIFREQKMGKRGKAEEATRKKRWSQRFWDVGVETLGLVASTKHTPHRYPKLKEKHARWYYSWGVGGRMILSRKSWCWINVKKHYLCGKLNWQ